MSSLRYKAAEQLGALLEAASSLLTGNVTILEQPPAEEVAYPALAVIPQRFVWDPFPGEEVEDGAGDPIMVNADADAVVCVGSLEGTAQLWVASRYPAQREQIEDAILTTFAADDNAPGRLLGTLTGVTVGGFAIGVDLVVAFQLRDATWREEKVMAERRWSLLDVAVDVPVLTLRKDAHVVTTLALALTGDLNTTVDVDADLANLTEVEQFEVLEDGTVDPYP